MQSTLHGQLSNMRLKFTDKKLPKKAATTENQTYKEM